MSETYSIGMALMDFLPNFAFLVGAYFLVRMVLRLRSRACARMLTVGTFFVFMGGFTKAVWKLMAAFGTDITFLGQMQFVLAAIGFLGMVVTVILLARHARFTQGIPLLAMAAWKIPFLAVMTISSLGAQGILTYLSFKWGTKAAGYLFALAVLCMLGMAGMASGEQTIARQWIEQSVNLLGQSSFMVGSILLERKSRQMPEGACK